MSGHSFFTLQLHPNDFCFGDKMLRLCENIIELMFLRQLLLILTVFLWNILRMAWFCGKYFESRRKNFTLLEKGRLNHIIFSAFYFFAFCWLLVQHSLRPHWSPFLLKHPCMALLIHQKYPYWMVFRVFIFQLILAIVWECLVDG